MLSQLTGDFSWSYIIIIFYSYLFIFFCSLSASVFVLSCVRETRLFAVDTVEICIAFDDVSFVAATTTLSNNQKINIYVVNSKAQ